MGKTESKTIPILGQPVFRISENPLEERVTLAGERGVLNSLVYFAVDAVMVRKLEYDGPNLNKIIINRDMTAENNPEESVEIRYDVEKNFSREANAETVFVDEDLANQIAAKLNKNQKTHCGKLLDLVTKAYNEYDKVIAVCKEVASK